MRSADPLARSRLLDAAESAAAAAALASPGLLVGFVLRSAAAALAQLATQAPASHGQTTRRAA
ncbi:MAG: hypothetical protein M1522_07285 [Actinobacteria bacterium]|nr:hypothetical protein [Actinomycetota bacterium]